MPPIRPDPELKASGLSRRQFGRGFFWREIGLRRDGPPRWKARCAAATRLRNAWRGWRGDVTRHSWCRICRLRDSCDYSVNLIRQDIRANISLILTG